MPAVLLNPFILDAVGGGGVGNPTPQPATATSTVPQPGISGGGFNPLTDIAWDEAHWASDPSWTPPSDGGVVSTWRDGSGNSRPSVNPNSGAQPLYRASVAGLNSRPAIEFDGTDDYLNNDASYTRAQPFTVVAVVTAWAQSSAALTLAGATGTSIRIGQGYPSSYAVAIYAGGSDFVAGPTGNANAHLYTFLFNGASSKIGQDGTLTTLGASPGTTGVTTGFTIGARNDAGVPAAVTVAFFGVYNGDFAANAQYGAFKSWVASFYGITVA